MSRSRPTNLAASVHQRLLNLAVARGDDFNLVLTRFPAPQVRAYPVESVIAEKLYAMVTLGEANTRMKDFYDVWFLARRRAFDGVRLTRAIAATFARRGTVPPADRPLAFSSAFSQHPTKQQEWQAFLTASRLPDVSDDLATVIAEVSQFLLPPLMAIAQAEVFDRRWTAAGGWS